MRLALFGPFIIFFHFFCILLLLMSVLGTICLREDGDDEIGPKRRVWAIRKLFFLPFVFTDTNQCI
jgi:hypothetical protein